MKITPRPFPRRAAKKLVEFLPYFKENNTFKYSNSGIDKGAVYDTYDTEYPTTLNEFIKLYESCFVAVYFDNRGDWELEDRSEELIANPKLIATIDLLTLRILFGSLTNTTYKNSKVTMHVFNADIIVHMLLRLEILMYEIPVVAKENEVWLDKIIAWADKKGIEDYYTRPKTLNTIWGGLPRDKELLLNSYTLEIGWNDLDELPKEIGNLTNLIEIRAWCSNLTKLPKEIGNLVNLRELSLLENNLRELPKEIGNLKNLLVLTLSNNPLKNLPKEIGDLENLEIMEVSESNIKELPKEIDRLHKLKELRIESCKKLTKIPTEIESLHSLKSLILRSNSIEIIPASIGTLSQLIHLDLSRNRLTSIPEKIGKLINLKSLDLRDNLFTEIPKAIVHLTQLKQWDIHRNPPFVIARKEINIDNLVFSTLPPHVHTRMK